jgi:hypothetical protein
MELKRGPVSRPVRVTPIVPSASFAVEKHSAPLKKTLTETLTETRTKLTTEGLQLGPVHQMLNVPAMTFAI